jgi:DNA-binding CsgD family transcriptional regulator
VSYLGDRAHHEQFARELAAAASSVHWAGHARADIVLLDQNALNRLSSCLVTSTVFLVACPSDKPLEALPPGVRGVLNCAAATSAELLAAAAEVSSLLGPRETGPLLTSTEIEVLWCAAAGMTIEATAQRLRITPSGGRAVLNSAKRKLGARTRANAVALAFRHGLVR